MCAQKSHYFTYREAKLQYRKIQESIGYSLLKRYVTFLYISRKSLAFANDNVGSIDQEENIVTFRQYHESECMPEGHG